VKWISVEDRLPEKADMQKDRNGFYSVIYWGKEDWNFCDDYEMEKEPNSFCTTGYVEPNRTAQVVNALATHWMPLPEPPESE